MVPAKASANLVRMAYTRVKAYELSGTGGTHDSTGRRMRKWYPGNIERRN